MRNLLRYRERRQTAAEDGLQDVQEEVPCGVHQEVVYHQQ